MVSVAVRRIIFSPIVQPFFDRTMGILAGRLKIQPKFFKQNGGFIRRLVVKIHTHNQKIKDGEDEDDQGSVASLV